MRKLTAILFTDIIGFTRKMSDDERDTLEILNLNQKLHRKIVRKYKGRLVKAMGDGYLCTFDSSLQAVMAALQLERSVNRLNRFQLRIGIHVADVLFQGDDIYGEGVNLAARIESQAPGAGVWVSDRVANDLGNHAELNLTSAGRTAFKGISNEIEIFQVQPADLDYFGRTQAVRLKKSPFQRVVPYLAVIAIIGLTGMLGWHFWPQAPANNTVVVTPFDYQGGADVGHLYLAESFENDLAAVLSEQKHLSIISGKEAEAWLSRNNADPSNTGIYQLTGTVSYLNERLAIDIQLISAHQTKILWQNTYRGDINQLFLFQSQAAEDSLLALKKATQQLQAVSQTD